jgi:hypothetical protein
MHLNSIWMAIGAIAALLAAAIAADQWWQSNRNVAVSMELRDAKMSLQRHTSGKYVEYSVALDGQLVILNNNPRPIVIAHICMRRSNNSKTFFPDIGFPVVDWSSRTTGPSCVVPADLINEEGAAPKYPLSLAVIRAGFAGGRFV